MRVDVAHTDEDALRTHLEMLLNARVVNLTIKHVDLVNDTTLVEVRYEHMGDWCSSEKATEGMSERSRPRRTQRSTAARPSTR